MDVFVWRARYVDGHEPTVNPIEMVDVAGFDVEARDGHIGKVDEATYESGASYLVVDTGFWIFGKKRMIPAGLVERVDPDERKEGRGQSGARLRPQTPARGRLSGRVGDHYQRVSR